MNDFSSEEFHSLLSENEKEKCERLFDLRDRKLYILSRGWLRKLLSAMTGTDLSEIIFGQTANGKPVVKGNEEIQFSVAHTQEVFVIAFANELRVGADVEKLDRCLAIDKLSDFLFSHAEFRQYISLHEEDCSEALINCWTRKEALLKALETGLTVPMNQVEVEFRPDEQPEVISVFGSEAEGNKWCLKSFDLLNNYRAAVAVRGEVKSTKLCNLSALSENYPRLAAELQLK